MRKRNAPMMGDVRNFGGLYYQFVAPHDSAMRPSNAARLFEEISYSIFKALPGSPRLIQYLTSPGALSPYSTQSAFRVPLTPSFALFEAFGVPGSLRDWYQAILTGCSNVQILKSSIRTILQEGTGDEWVASGRFNTFPLRIRDMPGLRSSYREHESEESSLIDYMWGLKKRGIYDYRPHPEPEIFVGNLTAFVNASFWSYVSTNIAQQWQSGLGRTPQTPIQILIPTCRETDKLLREWIEDVGEFECPVALSALCGFDTAGAGCVGDFSSRIPGVMPPFPLDHPA